MKNTMRSALILLSMLVGFANGDDLEDFVNNLSTDLAPLLALFGERITMQFISQAVSFADCFALAMVPLGIITIMVSAIRVGGPTWLKAVVGRAKENRAVPELELMSSTSEEVCELYNGKHIVRCLGLGSIGQYTCLFRKGFLSSEAGAENWRIEFKTLREALQDGFLIQNEGPDLGGDVSITRRRKLEWIWTRFRQTVLASNSKHDDSLESGNIFSRHREPQEPDTQPTLIVIHDTEPEAPNIALNLQDTYAQTRIGVAAVFGLLVQSAVVGFFVYVHKGPEFQLKDGKPIPGYAFWTAVAGTISVALGILLCAHVVEKSTIEAFYRADDKFEMGVYWVQYRQRVNDQVFEPFVLSPSKTCSIISRSRRNKENGTVLSSKTVFGVLFGLSGTILQFVGLRGMNSMASLAQLIAIGITTATRCIARPGFTSSFIKAKPRIGFELDWLAKRLTAVARNTTADPLIAPWLITMSREAQHQVLEPLTGRMRHQLPVSEAQSILVTRRGLSKLTPIPDNLRQKAGNLASALNVALNTLFPQGPRHGGGEGFRWFLNVRIRGQEQNQRVWIDLPFKEGRWSLEADDLVAVLSLWASVDPGEDEMSVEQAWEHVDPTEDRREPGMEPYLSEAYRNKEQVIQDMNTWAPQDHETLEAIRGISEGWGRASRSASFSGEHCEDVCATHLLFSFTWSMAMTLQDSLSGRTEPRRNAASNPDEQRSPLWNSQLARLAKAFAQVSARSEQAIILELIWSLSVAGKLPFPQPWFASMSATIMEGCRSGESKYFSKATTEAFYLIQTYAKGASGISERAAAWLLEQFHNMKDASERVGQSYGLEPAQLRARCEHLVDALTLNNATGDRLGPDFLGHMTELYRLQGREMDKMFCNTTSERLPTRFVTPLHRRAMIRGITTDDVPPEQRAIVNFRDVTNRTPLHCAAASGNAAVAKYLLNQHADIGLADSGGLTAAHHACLSGCGEILAMLIEKRAELKSQANNGASPMHLAAGEGHHDVVENLLKRKTPLGSPCKRDPEEELTKIALLRLRDFDGCMPVHWAAAGGHTQVLEPLKESIDAQGYRGWTPLHIAVMTGNGRLISALYRMSANGEIKDYSGRTPLVLACSERKWEVIQELVDAGAKLDAVDPQGRTALHYMADGDAITKLISILTESVDSTTAKDLANLQDQSGHTPLHLAAEHGNSAAVGQLLEAGAEANAINDREETPLFLGLRGAKTEEEAYRMAEALVGHGDRLEFESAEGESLIDVARRRNFAGVASYLEAERERREKENSTWTFDSWGDVRDVRCVCGERLAEWQLRQVDGEEAPGCHQCGLKPKEWQIRRDDGKEKCLDFWRDVRCVCGARLAEWQVRQVDGEEAAGCHQCGLKPKEWQL